MSEQEQLKEIMNFLEEEKEPSDDRFVKKEVKDVSFKAPEEPKKEATVQPVQELSPEKKKFNQQMQIAVTLSKSTIVPAHFRGKPEDIFACVMLGAELGFQPMMSLNSIIMIQGNATLKAQTMLAVVKAKCPQAIISIVTDDEKKSVSVTTKRDASDPGYTATWNIDKVKAMGLASKDNYLKQFMTMIRWRATSEAVRYVFADVLMGIQSTEDMIDTVINAEETNKTVNLANDTFKS